MKITAAHQKGFLFPFIWLSKCFEKRKWIAVNSSVVLYQPQKIFSRWPERENTKVYLHPYSHSSAIQVMWKILTSQQLPFLVLRALFGNVIRSVVSFCHAAGTVGHWPSPCSHQLFSAVTGQESNLALPAPLYQQCLFVLRPDWRLATSCLPPLPPACC